jgi:hypothetical protein
MAATCTVVVAAHMVRCGKPAVYAFTGSGGEAFAECSEHFDPRFHTVAETGPKVGDKVDVWRHGRAYVGTVVRVGKRGAVDAEIVYGNGVRRVVRASERAGR